MCNNSARITRNWKKIWIEGGSIDETCQYTDEPVTENKFLIVYERNNQRQKRGERLELRVVTPNVHIHLQ